MFFDKEYKNLSVDVTELEVVIFEAGGFSFGVEVSQITSVQVGLESTSTVVGICEEKMEQRAKSEEQEHFRFAICDLRLQSKIENQKSSIPTPCATESIPIVDLSMQLVKDAGAQSWVAECENLGSPSARISEKVRMPESREADLQTPAYAEGAAPILLVEMATGAMGVCVESVRGVVKIPLEQIEPLPGFLKSRIKAKAGDCIWGIGKLGEELVILLDLDRYVKGDE